MAQTENNTIKNRLINSRTVFVVSILVITLTVIGVWWWGVGQHRSIYENSFISLSILSVFFFTFISVGLYRGIKMKDNIGDLSEQLKLSKIPDLSSHMWVEFFHFDGIIGILISIVVWLAVSIALVFFFWALGAVLWVGGVLFVAMLYWIFFRALRLVFKNSYHCKGNVFKSIAYALFYTFLYNSWMYAVTWVAQMIS